MTASAVAVAMAGRTLVHRVATIPRQRSPIVSGPELTVRVGDRNVRFDPSGARPASARLLHADLSRSIYG